MNTIVRSDKYPYHDIFSDAAKVIAQMPGDDTICFGVWQWTAAEVESARRQCSNRLIFYQAEPLCDEGSVIRHDGYVSLMKQFDEVWDYSEHNIQWLKQNGIDNVRYVPVLPSELLKEPTMEHDIDILHLGTHSVRRCFVLNRLTKMGYRVYDALRENHQSVHGEAVHTLYLRSKVLLGIHRFSHNHIQESFRYQFPLSNDIVVVAEKSISNPLGLDEWQSFGSLLKILSKYVKPEALSDDEYMRKYIFLDQDSYLMDSELAILKEADMTAIFRAITYMSLDADMASRLKRLGLRSDDLVHVNRCLVMGLIPLIMYLQTNKSGISRHRRKVAFCRLHRIYNNIDRTIARRFVLSTGGFLWPRIRCLLQLSGWWTLYLSSLLFYKFGCADKFTYPYLR